MTLHRAKETVLHLTSNTLEKRRDEFRGLKINLTPQAREMSFHRCVIDEVK